MGCEQLFCTIRSLKRDTYKKDFRFVEDFKIRFHVSRIEAVLVVCGMLALIQTKLWTTREVYNFFSSSYSKLEYYKPMVYAINCANRVNDSVSSSCDWGERLATSIGAYTALPLLSSLDNRSAQKRPLGDVRHHSWMTMVGGLGAGLGWSIVG